MRPEVDSSDQLKVEIEKEEYLEIGVPEEWIDPLKALGYDTVDKIKRLSKLGKPHQEIMGYRKKPGVQISGVLSLVCLLSAYT